MNTIITYEIKLSWGSLYNPPSEILNVLVEDIKAFHPKVPIQYIFSDFHFSVDEDLKYINVKTEIDKNEMFDGEEPDAGWEHLLDETITRRLNDLLFTMNLAYPGVFHIFKSWLCRDGRPLQEPFSYAVDISSFIYEKCKWLKFEKLTIQQCWDWIMSKTNFLSYISRTSIDRALHALSYESVANDNMYIFYTLLGIEAIYNDGSNREDSIMEQIRRKSQSLLGELPANAIKSLNEMYRMRSKLVHGSANICKCWWSEDYEETEFDKLCEDRDYMVTATGLLIATIHKFIKANANSLVETITIKLV